MSDRIAVLSNISQLESSTLAVSRTGDEISKVPAGVCSSGGGAGGAEGLSSDAVGAVSKIRLSFFFES